MKTSVSWCRCSGTHLVGVLQSSMYFGGKTYDEAARGVGHQKKTPCTRRLVESGAESKRISWTSLVGCVIHPCRFEHQL